MADDFDTQLAKAPGPRQGAGAVDFDAMLAAAPGPKVPLATSHGEGDQYMGWGRYPAKVGSDLVSVAESLVGMPEQVSGILTSGFNKGADWLLGVSPEQRAARDKVVPTWGFTPGAWAEQGTNALGITNNPHLAPQNMFERHFDASVKAVPLIASAVMSGGMNVIPATVSGLAAANAAEAVPEGHPIAALGAGVLAGMGGQGLAQSLSGNKLEKVAAALGKSSTWQEAGEELQNSARDWLKALPGKLTAVAAPLDRAVPADAPVSLDPILGALKQITSKGGTLAAAIESMSGKLPGKLKEVFSNIKDLNELAGGPNATAWRDVREFRTYLGNAMADPKLAGGLDEASLKHLYKVTTETLGDTATAHGAGDLWKEFNTESTRLHQIQRGPMKKLVSTDNPAREKITPETAGRAMFNSAKKGGSELEDLRLELPQAVNEVGAAALRQGVWDKLSPEGKLQLVTDPKHQRALRWIETAPPSDIREIAHVGKSGLGALAGGAIGKAIAHGLELDPGTAEGVGEAIGIALPWAARAGAHMLRNPATRNTIPLSSAVGLTVNGLQPTGKR